VYVTGLLKKKKTNIEKQIIINTLMVLEYNTLKLYKGNLRN